MIRRENVIDWWMAFLSIGVGLALGLFYFGGLWFTVQKISSSRHPALLTMASFLVRSAAVLLVFFFVMDGHIERLAALMIGFLVSRQILVARLRPQRAA
jgi:F1F0 ATPase subunit 2